MNSELPVISAMTGRRRLTFGPRLSRCSRLCFTPQLTTHELRLLSLFGPSFWARCSSENRSHFSASRPSFTLEFPGFWRLQFPDPRPSEWLRFQPSKPFQGSARRRLQPTASSGSKLGRLRCARQGIVRVPESNTKYGGFRRKTGGQIAPCRRQVSVSPERFGKQKIWSRG